MIGPDRRLLAISVAVVVVPLLALAGIYIAIFWGDPENDHLGDTIRFALPEGEPGDRTTLDLDQLVDGDWDRLVVSCRGDRLDGVAGDVEIPVESSSPDATRQGASVMLYFVNETEVVASYNRDADMMAEPVYFDPCMGAVASPVVLDRSDARLSLVMDGYGRWLIDREAD